ncbi:ankyrin repeat domain-containing protein 33B isoform X2 [Nerophis ophidion]|uniref:ankyrin repeat domain-containing protein 33B isoform X2 n=1 Tax=Nerophis ophidion TaxID=159077 RepID=UPI002ADF5E30|nr:ankyrin repeat domain-containing protein 33B isoform X2 [Nerophis ophidion]
MASTSDDPNLGAGPHEDSEITPDDSDSGSVLSDDSVLPNFERDDKYAEPPKTLYEACTRNDPTSLQRILERGVTKEEAMELDINGRSGLMVAVCKGFVDIVTRLHMCPLIDINHQDNDGNTALMIAAQAGADMNATDHVQGRGLKDWVLKTGRFETMNRIRRLQAFPVAQQFCENYTPEWPDLKQIVEKATAHKTTGQKLKQCLKGSFTFSFPQDPQDNGVMDNMVRMTTSIHSPLIATGCHPLCPSSPPEIGKRRFAVPELLDKHSNKELEESTVSHSYSSITSPSPSAASVASISLTSCCQESDRRESMPPGGMRGFIPRSIAHRNSIFPAGCVPKIEVTRSGEATPKKEKKNKKQKGYLEPPVWKYKAAKEEKKREKKEKEQERMSNGSKQNIST